MSVRSRIKTKVFTGLRKRLADGVYSDDSYISSNERCDDTVTPGDNGPLTITRREVSGGTISGLGHWYDWYDYPCTYMSDSYLHSHLTIPDLPSYGGLATELLSRTNPSRPSSAVLEYASELHNVLPRIKDNLSSGMSKLFRHITPGRFAALTRIAKLNLMVQFGILPMVSDIRLLVELQGRVDQRSKEIDRLRTRGLRRTVDLWRGSNSQDLSLQYMQTEGTTIQSNIVKKTYCTIRGHARWYAQAEWLKSDPLVRAKLKDAILGYSLDPVTLYEIMPWSWFIDYLSNLGSMIKATRNMFDASHDVPRIMTHLRTEVRSYSHVYNDPSLKMDQIVCINETKERILTSASLSARIEALNARQWSILGSLAILRG